MIEPRDEPLSGRQYNRVLLLLIACGLAAFAGGSVVGGFVVAEIASKRDLILWSGLEDATIQLDEAAKKLSLGDCNIEGEINAARESVVFTINAVRAR